MEAQKRYDRTLRRPDAYIKHFSCFTPGKNLIAIISMQAGCLLLLCAAKLVIKLGVLGTDLRDGPNGTKSSPCKLYAEILVAKLNK